MLPSGSTVRHRAAWWLYYAALAVMAVPVYIVVLASFGRIGRIGPAQPGGDQAGAVSAP